MGMFGTEFVWRDLRSWSFSYRTARSFQCTIGVLGSDDLYWLCNKSPVYVKRGGDHECASVIYISIRPFVEAEKTKSYDFWPKVDNIVLVVQQTFGIC